MISLPLVSPEKSQGQSQEGFYLSNKVKKKEGRSVYHSSRLGLLDEDLSKGADRGAGFLICLEETRVSRDRKGKGPVDVKETE